MKQLVEVSPLGSDAEAPLAEFLAAWPGETLPEGAWRRRFALWWQDNPYCAPGAPRGFTIESAGRTVGFFGLIPIGFQLGGRDVVAYASTTWRVEPAFRHRTLAALSMIVRACRGAPLFVWTTNPSLVKVLEALRFSTLPRPPCFFGRQQTTLLTRPGRVLAQAIAPAARLPGAVAAVHPALVWARARIGSRGLAARRVERADESFDRFWERTRGRVRHTIPRSASFLNWHLSGDVEKWLYGCYRNGELSGLLLGCVKRPRGLRVLDCADVWLDPDVPGALDALFARVIADCMRAGGADAIELPHYSADIHRFARRRTLLPRPVDDRTELVLAPRDVLADLGTGSYFTGLVGDRYL